ncbi:MAG: maltooligosyltrehalose trehalohydrolase [Acidimicrobiaceae bacterium]|jgi:maltooligosyltrehalose trehalohydrolase
MESVGDGWYRAPLVLPPNADYGFALDGGEPLPDPRSQWQPAGVSGPSRVVDHDAFEWTDRQWSGIHLPASVIYEVHVGTFSGAGTFDGVIEHLGHLVALGVDVIEVMPVAPFDGGRGWGYDGVALYAVHEPYGGPEGLKRLVDAAHARGIGVLLDVVYNHFGPTGNHLNEFGPYTTDRHQTPWGDAVNLDGPDSAPVRRFFLDNARHWLTNYHVDGLRLDAVHALIDESDRHFLAELAEDVDALAAHLGRSLWLVAEYPKTEPMAVTAPEAGGHGLHAEWRDEVHHAVHAWITGERDGYYSDFGRVATLAEALIGPKRDLPRSRFVVCAQNHDQVGNRARGDRLCHTVDIGLAKAAAALVICSPFVPLLFMGEDWAASSPFPYFAGPRNEDLDDAVRRGRLEEFAAFGWDPDDIPDPIAESTFASARLRWGEVYEDQHREMQAWYRALISLRRTRPELSDPRPSSTGVDEHDSEHAIVVWRGSTAIAVNIDTSPVHLALEPAPDRSVLLASHGTVQLTDDGVVLPPHSVAIIG